MYEIQYLQGYGVPHITRTLFEGGGLQERNLRIARPLTNSKNKKHLKLETYFSKADKIKQAEARCSWKVVKPYLEKKSVKRSTLT